MIIFYFDHLVLISNFESKETGLLYIEVGSLSIAIAPPPREWPAPRWFVMSFSWFATSQLLGDGLC